MSRRGWALIAGVVAAALIALGVTWFLRTYHQVERTIDLPQTGEVTWNELFVLQLALEADGMRARSMRRLPNDLDGIGAGDTVLLLGDPRGLDAGATQRILAWVEAGGHLLVRTTHKLEIDDAQPTPMLDALGVVVQASARCTSLRVPGQDDHTEFCRGRRFEVTGPVLHAWRGEQAALRAGTDLDELAWRERREVERMRRQAARDAAGDANTGAETDAAGDDADPDQDEDQDEDEVEVEPLSADEARALTRLGAGQPQATGLVYARLQRGRGTVDVAADFDMLTNDSIDEVPHIAFARQLLPRARAGTVHLIHDARMPSFWLQLLGGFWMAWKPLALAMLAWLWLRAQRLGPVLPTPPAERRSLLEHIAASGEHAWRYGRGHLLHGAMRHAFLARLRRRDPFAAALDGEPQVVAIAERTGQPAGVVRDALATPVGIDPATFRSRIAALVRLRNLL